MKTPYVYKIKSIYTGKYYIGSQYGKNSNPQNFWKTYFTSSKYVNKNINEFKVIYVKPRKDAREYEHKLLGRIYSIYGKEKFCNIMLNRNLAPGIIHDQEEKKRISVRLKKRWDSGIMKEPHKKATSTRKTKVYKKVPVSKEARDAISERMRINNPMFDDNVRKKHKDSMNSPESIRKKSLSKIGNTNCKGKTWFNNGVQTKMLFDCPDGWVKGRLNPHWNHNRKEKND